MENYICKSEEIYQYVVYKDLKSPAKHARRLSRPQNDARALYSSGVYICKSIVNYLRHGKLHM